MQAPLLSMCPKSVTSGENVRDIGAFPFFPPGRNCGRPSHQPFSPPCLGDITVTQEEVTGPGHGEGW